MAHFQKARKSNLELVAQLIRDNKPNWNDEREVENFYDIVQWNTGSKRQTAEEYVRLVLKFSRIYEGE